MASSAFNLGGRGKLIKNESIPFKNISGYPTGTQYLSWDLASESDLSSDIINSLTTDNIVIYGTGASSHAEESGDTSAIISGVTLSNGVVSVQFSCKRSSGRHNVSFSCKPIITYVK